MKDVVPARHVGGDPTLRTLKKVIAVVVPLFGFYLVLQVGALLDTGGWAAGGLNPLQVLITWLFGARPWSGTYTALAVGVAVATLVAFLVWERLRRSRPGKTRVDPVARYLSRGESFTEDAVRRHAEDAQLSAEGLVGIPLAKVVRTGKWFWAGFRDGVIAIMGPGSHKTTGLVITGALDAPGPVWVTSNRPDVVAALYTSRADKGTTWVFVVNHRGASGMALVVDEDGNPRLDTRWVNDVDGQTPILVGGVLYFARGHELVALDPETGKKLWSDNSLGLIHWQSPIIVNGRIYVSDQESHLFAYDAR